MVRIVIAGPPGSGKGTICNRIIVPMLNVMHVSTGDILRDVPRESGLGVEIRSYIH